MNRPLSNLDQLEHLFREKRDSVLALPKLLEELKHRSTKRATTLRAKVEAGLANLEEGCVSEPFPRQLELPFDEK